MHYAFGEKKNLLDRYVLQFAHKYTNFAADVASLRVARALDASA
jgi:hypothetical protein